MDNIGAHMVVTPPELEAEYKAQKKMSPSDIRSPNSDLRKSQTSSLPHQIDVRSGDDHNKKGAAKRQVKIY